MTLMNAGNAAAAAGRHQDQRKPARDELT